jgi:transposase
LDVHARSVVACAIDTVSGELTRARLCPDHAQVLDWLARLAGPVAVVYEAGPTGFGLARAVRAAGVRCEVVAPSKLQRPSGDRVKTDARDALHLARLLRLDEITRVRVPTVAQEAARDLVRAREDVRAELMRARHRTSKLLLRQGVVWSGGGTWTFRHHAWLARQSFDRPALQIAYDSAYEAVLIAESRRDRLDKAITAAATDPAWAGVVARLGCLRGIDTLTAFGLAVEIGDWNRFTGSSIGAYLGLVPSESSSGQSRSQGPITKTGNTHARRLLVEAAWHHPGPTAPPPPSARAGTKPRPPRAPADTPATNAYTNAGSPSPNTTSDQWWPTSPSPANWPAGAGHWPFCPNNRALRPAGRHPGGGSARSDPRYRYGQRAIATPDPRPAETLQPNSPSCGNQPAHISMTTRRQRHAHHPGTDRPPKTQEQRPENNTGTQPTHTHMTEQPTYQPSAHDGEHHGLSGLSRRGCPATRAPVSTGSVSALVGLERQRDGVDAVALAGRLVGGVVEDVAEVGAAVRAADFDAVHAVRAVGEQDDGVVLGRLVERRPAAVGVELGL